MRYRNDDDDDEVPPVVHAHKTLPKERQCLVFTTSLNVHTRTLIGSLSFSLSLFRLFSGAWTWTTSSSRRSCWSAFSTILFSSPCPPTRFESSSECCRERGEDSECEAAEAGGGGGCYRFLAPLPFSPSPSAILVRQDGARLLSRPTDVPKYRFFAKKGGTAAQTGWGGVRWRRNDRDGKFEGLRGGGGERAGFELIR